jgi:hypothetical protein
MTRIGRAREKGEFNAGCRASQPVRGRFLLRRYRARGLTGGAIIDAGAAMPVESVTASPLSGRQRPELLSLVCVSALVPLGHDPGIPELLVAAGPVGPVPEGAAAVGLEVFPTAPALPPRPLRPEVFPTAPPLPPGPLSPELPVPAAVPPADAPPLFPPEAPLPPSCASATAGTASSNAAARGTTLIACMRVSRFFDTTWSNGWSA